MAIYTFIPANAVTPLSTGATFIPAPWLQDPSATDAASVVADASITVDGSTVSQRIQDGWMWIQLADPETPHTYARTEITCTQQMGAQPYPAGQLTSIEWRGFYTTGLPEETSGEYFLSPGQIHNSSNVGSPHYSYQINSGTGVVNFEIHNLDGSLRQRVPFYNISDMVNTPTTLKQYYKPNSADGVEDGSITVERNGVYVWSETGTENCINPSFDYSKFGVYDFTNAITDPDTPGEGRSITMTTELYQIVNL